MLLKVVRDLRFTSSILASHTEACTPSGSGTAPAATSFAYRMLYPWMAMGSTPCAEPPSSPRGPTSDCSA